MKSDNKKLREYISLYIKKYLAEAEEEAPAEDTKEEEAPADEEGGGDNPFAAAAGDEGGEEEKEDAPKEKGAEEPAGIPIKFNVSSVKKYNKQPFLSDRGVVKSISKDGIIVTTQPDQVDILVNFNDISESVKQFFKKKK